MTDYAQFEVFVNGATVAGPVDESALQDAEARLGVVFPPSYRKFLQKYGAAFGSFGEIAGIPPRLTDDACPQWIDVVELTSLLRKASRGHLPQNYIFISDDGGDYKYVLDTAQSAANGECAVVMLGPGSDGQIIAGDFAEFVSRLCSRSLQLNVR